mmetsp:Transcript_4731/g.21164  ORF Transcript_4731/g.21164 Transcript_4731/m.21164 type:complete len:252 (+) Transcript_4731:3415-4170(+)
MTTSRDRFLPAATTPHRLKTCAGTLPSTYAANACASPDSISRAPPAMATWTYGTPRAASLAPTRCEVAGVVRVALTTTSFPEMSDRVASSFPSPRSTSIACAKADSFANLATSSGLGWGTPSLRAHASRASLARTPGAHALGLDAGDGDPRASSAACLACDARRTPRGRSSSSARDGGATCATTLKPSARSRRSHVAAIGSSATAPRKAMGCASFAHRVVPVGTRASSIPSSPVRFRRSSSPSFFPSSSRP